MKKQKNNNQKNNNEFDLNSLPLLPELIKEIRSFLPKSWVLYKKGKYNLKKGDAVRIEKLDYGNLKSKSIYNVPPTIDCVGKIIKIYGDLCMVRFLKRRYRNHITFREAYYLLDTKHIRRVNFPDKKKVNLNKKNIITF